MSDPDIVARCYMLAEEVRKKWEKEAEKQKKRKKRILKVR